MKCWQSLERLLEPRNDRHAVWSRKDLDRRIAASNQAERYHPKLRKSKVKARG